MFRWWASRKNHSSQTNFEIGKRERSQNVYLHLFTDGRDTPIDSGVKYIDNIEKFLKRLGIGKIATIGGRVYGMDREKDMID